MKQILVISGKGGTGKTVITSAFASLAENKVMVDCDVDAADLHILLKPEVRERNEFRSGVSAELNADDCRNCGKCIATCRFDAIHSVDGAVIIDPVDCEGCGFCSLVCPRQAIRMVENIAGEWYVSDTRFGPMVHAKLGVAEENSGKLVSQVRQKAKELAEEKKCDWVIIDGSPGIGCPVIASLSGIDVAVIVTEPTMSGLHDADRVIQVAKHFNVPSTMLINKYDLNEEMTATIEKYCAENGITVLGKIAFDENVVKALMAQQTIVEHQENNTAEQIRVIWRSLIARFEP